MTMLSTETAAERDREFTDLPWLVFRCRGCDLVLLKRTSTNPLQYGEKVAVKCRSCRTLNVMVGSPVDTLSQAALTT